jgi:hypothetical protein
MDTYPRPPQDEGESAGLPQPPEQPLSQAGEDPAQRQDPEAELDDLTAKLREENVALLGGMSDEELRSGIRVGRNNFNIGKNHRPGVFERDLLLFVAEDSSERELGGHLWEPYVHGQITEVHVPCTHSNMVEPDMLGQVWAAIAAWLEARG